ncbi:hypothetical protein Pelo_16520 [Pelomyxa schiedti]|nr:hypothetical protein Pelo_16520 [Pelomyxa schiedti]
MGTGPIRSSSRATTITFKIEMGATGLGPGLAADEEFSLRSHAHKLVPAEQPNQPQRPQEPGTVQPPDYEWDEYDYGADVDDYGGGAYDDDSFGDGGGGGADHDERKKQLTTGCPVQEDPRWRSADHLGFDPKKLVAVMPFGDLKRLKKLFRLDSQPQSPQACIDEDCATSHLELCTYVARSPKMHQDAIKACLSRNFTLPLRKHYRKLCHCTHGAVRNQYWGNHHPSEKAPPEIDQSCTCHKFLEQLILLCGEKICDSMLNTTLALACAVGNLFVVQHLVDSIGVNPAVNLPIFDALTSARDTSEVVRFLVRCGALDALHHPTGQVDPPPSDLLVQLERKRRGLCSTQVGPS